MEFRPYVRAVRNWWWLLLLATALAAGTGYWNSSRQVRIFQTTATVRVGQFTESTDPRLSDYSTSQQLAQVYAQSVERQPILQATVDTLGLRTSWQSLAPQVQAFVPAQSSLIQVGVVDTDPERAKAIADEVARQLVLQSPSSHDAEQEEHRKFVAQQMGSLMSRIQEAEQQVQDMEAEVLEETSAVRIQALQDRITALQQRIAGWESTYASLLQFYSDSPINSLTVIDSASVPTQPISPNTFRDVLIAASLGFILAAGAAILIEYVDQRVNDPEDIVKELGLPVLCSVARIRLPKGQRAGAVPINGAAVPVAEAFRILRTNIHSVWTSREDNKMILVTSGSPREGKSMTAVNLALSFARSGRRTILVDLDLHCPSLHTILALPITAGVGTIFSREQKAGEEEIDPTDDALSLVSGWPVKEGLPAVVQSLLVKTSTPNLLVLPSGPSIKNSADYLASTLTDRIMAALQEIADVVVLDSPPLLAVADASILAGRGASVVLVIEAGRTRVAEARKAQEMLASAQATVLGVVLNKSSKGSVGYYSRYRARDLGTASPEQTQRAAVVHAQQRHPSYLPGSQLDEASPTVELREGNASGA